MKKSYTYPVIDILPFYAVTTLCASEEHFDVEENGKDPWIYSRAPRRTPAF